MKNLVLVFFLLIITASRNASAQVTVDNTSFLASGGSQSSLSWPHTVGAGNSRLLVLNFSGYNPGAQGVNNVTYNGVALTKLTSKSNGSTYTEMWYLLNPPIGTYTVYVSYQRSQSVASAISFSGVDQATPFGTPAGAGGTSTSASVIVGSAPGELVLDALSTDNTTTHSITNGAGQTRLWELWNAQSHGAGSTEPGAALVTMSSTLSISRSWALAAVSIKPACIVGTPTPITVALGTEPTCQVTNSLTTTSYATTATKSTGYNWSISNPAAGSINAATGIMTWANGFAGTVDIQVTANGCNGPSAQVVRTVTVTEAGTWTGDVSTDWNTAGNWQCNIIPTITTNVTIPSGLSNYPVISSNTIATVKDITLNSASSVGISNGVLQIAGTLTTTGGKITATSGKVEFNGSVSQTVPANLFNTNIIKDLVITNSAGVTLTAPIRVTNTVSFGNVNNSALNSNGFLTLVSTSANTANVSDITNGGLNSGNKINGNVTVERYMQGRRAYRFLTAPVTSTTSIKSNWMENTNNPSTSVNNNPVPGYGTHITGAGGSANGFDATGTNNASLFTFNNATQAWIAAPNTAALFTAGSALRIMVRGSRSVDLNNNSAVPSSTTLRATGTLLTGPVLFTKTAAPNGVPALSGVVGAYNLIGNPYASTVDGGSVIATSTDISPTLYFFDPTISGSNGRGGYVSYNAILKVKNILGSLITKDIQSGQSFFVQTTGPNPSITFNESYKSTGFLPVFRTANELPYLTIALLLPEQVGTEDAADGTGVYFSEEYSSSIRDEDSYKFTNQDENLAILREGIALSLEGRKAVRGSDSVPLKIWQLTRKSYSLKINMENFASNVEGYLQDKFLNTATLLANGENVIPFSITSDAASSASNRFQVVFETLATLPVRLTGIKTYPKNKGVQIDWVAESESNVDLYEVEQSVDAVNFQNIGSVKAKNNPGIAQPYGLFDVNPSAGDNFYRIRTIEKSGEIKLSEVLRVQIASEKNTISIANNPVSGKTIRLLFDDVAKGNYSVNLVSSLGEIVYKGTVSYSGGTAFHQLDLANYLPVGIYHLQVNGNSMNKTIQVLIR